MHDIPEKRCFSYFEVKGMYLSTYFSSLFHQVPYNSAESNAKVIKHYLIFFIIADDFIFFSAMLSVNVCNSDVLFLLKY